MENKDQIEVVKRWMEEMRAIEDDYKSSMRRISRGELLAYGLLALITGIACLLPLVLWYLQS